MSSWQADTVWKDRGGAWSSTWSRWSSQRPQVCIEALAICCGNTKHARHFCTETKTLGSAQHPWVP